MFSRPAALRFHDRRDLRVDRVAEPHRPGQRGLPTQNSICDATQAAASLGGSRTTLHRKMRALRQRGDVPGQAALTDRSLA